MGVYIKGMEMPTSCMDCPFKGFDRAGGRGNICTINDSITLHAVLDGVDVKFVRMGDCPLAPVPPHGDLIDRDALIKDGWLNLHKMVMRMGGYAIHELPLKNPSIPVIIPASEEGE